MSRQIDIDNLTADDVPYLRDRPWLIDQYRRQGYTDHMDAVADGEITRESPVERSKITTDHMRVGTQVPQQVDSVPNGVTGEEPDELDDNYEEWSVAELKAEITERNKELGEDVQIPVSGNKDALVDRLHKADQAEAEAEGPST